MWLGCWRSPAGLAALEDHGFSGRGSGQPPSGAGGPLRSVVGEFRTRSASVHRFTAPFPAVDDPWPERSVMAAGCDPVRRSHPQGATRPVPAHSLPAAPLHPLGDRPFRRAATAPGRPISPVHRIRSGAPAPDAPPFGSGLPHRIRSRVRTTAPEGGLSDSPVRLAGPPDPLRHPRPGYAPSVRLWCSRSGRTASSPPVPPPDRGAPPPRPRCPPSDPGTRPHRLRCLLLPSVRVASTLLPRCRPGFGGLHLDRPVWLLRCRSCPVVTGGCGPGPVGRGAVLARGPIAPHHIAPRPYLGGGRVVSPARYCARWRFASLPISVEFASRSRARSRARWRGARCGAWCAVVVPWGCASFGALAARSEGIPPGGLPSPFAPASAVSAGWNPIARVAGSRHRGRTHPPRWTRVRERSESASVHGPGQRLGSVCLHLPPPGLIP
jgi:hypothetical protein